MPIIMLMFGVVIVSAILLSVAAYYGGDWTWIAQQNASLVLLFITLGSAFIVLLGWLKRR